MASALSRIKTNMGKVKNIFKKDYTETTTPEGNYAQVRQIPQTSATSASSSAPPEKKQTPPPIKTHKTIESYPNDTYQITTYDEANNPVNTQSMSKEEYKRNMELEFFNKRLPYTSEEKVAERAGKAAAVEETLPQTLPEMPPDLGQISPVGAVTKGAGLIASTVAGAKLGGMMGSKVNPVYGTAVGTAIGALTGFAGGLGGEIAFISKEQKYEAAKATNNFINAKTVLTANLAARNQQSITSEEATQVLIDQLAIIAVAKANLKKLSDSNTREWLSHAKDDYKDILSWEQYILPLYVNKLAAAEVTPMPGAPEFNQGAPKTNMESLSYLEAI